MAISKAILEDIYEVKNGSMIPFKIMATLGLTILGSF